VFASERYGRAGNTTPIKMNVIKIDALLIGEGILI
jgi:hypothetical protein